MAGDRETDAGRFRSGSQRRRSWLIFLGACAALGLIGEAAFRLFPLDPQLDYRFDEECYWSLEPDQSGRLWMGGGRFRSPVIHIGSDGFRRCAAGVPSPGGEEMLFLGDSYTFGLGVEDHETFSARIVEFLPGSGICPRNGGGPGYGVFQSAALLRREIEAGRTPDVVVLTLPTGDVLRQPFSEDELAAYRATQIRRKRLRDLSRMATFVYRKVIQIRGRNAKETRAVPNQRNPGASAAFGELWQADARRLSAMQALCRKHGSEFVVLHWPQPSAEGWNETVQQGLLELAEANGLAVLTGLEERFEGRRREELTIPGDGHPSVLAHQIVAEYLAVELASLLQRERAGGATSNRTP